MALAGIHVRHRLREHHASAAGCRRSPRGLPPAGCLTPAVRRPVRPDTGHDRSAASPCAAESKPATRRLPRSHTGREIRTMAMRKTVVVVGGGISGLAAAALAGRGADVTVVERADGSAPGTRA
ncbi:FAD-dependent oxidoreductase [Streptomyces sp. NPDC050388]|uniref:FAD-dependent oxidoreductase n=1 Tax=Streptomyces sp. NPDC050388 TaxID=3155781 RepID=UPI0034446458